MYVQEIIVTIIVLGALFYSARMFVLQFIGEEGSCSSCSCEPIEKRFKKAALNTPVFKKPTH